MTQRLDLYADSLAEAVKLDFKPNIIGWISPANNVNNKNKDAGDRHAGGYTHFYWRY